MHFISAKGGLRLTMRPGAYRERTVLGGDVIRYKDQPWRICFRKVSGNPLRVAAGVPFPNSVAEGQLDTSVAAEEFRMQGHTVDEDGKDITQEAIEEFMLNNCRDRGRLYILVKDDGLMERAQEAIIVPSGTGSYCTICEQQLSTNAGVQAHLGGNSHNVRYKLYQEEQDQAKALAGDGPPMELPTEVVAEQEVSPG